MNDSLNTQALIENLELALILIDHNRVVTMVNIATETLLSQSRRYLIGRELETILPLASVARCVADCLANGSQFTLRDISLKLPNKELQMDITLSYFSDSGQGNQPQVLIEINTLHRISNFIKENNKLERQQSFRTMVRGLAHEIKNPLGGIRGAAQLLDREIKNPEQRQLTDILIKEADRLSRLVDRVMGSRDQLKPAATNIHEVLEHVINLVCVDANNEISIERFYDPTLPEIVVDKEQLIQAVLNIFGNAIQAQSNNDTVTIGLVTRFERFVTLNQQLYRRAIKIQIWDEGPGVAEELSENLFEPLITGRADGTGLGLSITQEIIQRHHGLVQLDDYQGKTCFSIYLPYIASLEDKLESEKSNE